MDSYGTFKRAITRDEERPPIPAGIQIYIYIYICLYIQTYTYLLPTGSLIHLPSFALLHLYMYIDIHPSLKDLLERCWAADPALRPKFTEILPIIDSVC